VLGVYILPLSTIFIFDCGTVPTLWFFILYFALYYLHLAQQVDTTCVLSQRCRLKMSVVLSTFIVNRRKNMYDNRNLSHMIILLLCNW
jgi:hypothetical protein